MSGLPGAARPLILLLAAAAAGGCADDPDAGGPPHASSAPGARGGAAPTDPAEADSGGTADPREVQVFRCTGPTGEPFRIESRATDGQLELWLPERFERQMHQLDRVHGASGAKYEGGGVVFWNRGDGALLIAGGEEYRGCTLDRGGWVWAAARRRGVDFRASGNEPGWYMELTRGDSLHLVYDYGEDELTVGTPEPTGGTREGRLRYRAGTTEHDLTVTIDDEPCVAMSGTGFPKTVTVDLDGTSYRGCGRWLDTGQRVRRGGGR